MQKQQKSSIALIDNLQELQYRVKRTPEHYIPEMLQAIEKFKKQFEQVKLSPQLKHESFATLINFLAQVAELYKNNLQFLHIYLNDLLENYAQVMSPFLREKCVGALVILRNKQMVKPLDQLNTMLKLFRVQDKSLRKIVAGHIMSDIRKLKQNAQNQSIYKQMQNLIFEILKNNSDALAKYSVRIMISMYKKNFWNDAKTVNIIAHGCFNDWYKIRLICCYFLIETTVPKEIESSDEEDNNNELTNQSIKGYSKKTRSKMLKQEKERKILEKKRRRRQKLAVVKNFFPIDQIYNPQVFCEKLFNILKKNTKDRYEVKVVTMNVLARMIGRHKLFILNFYSYCQKYLYPHQKDIDKFLAFIAESCHSQIPQEELLPIVKHIITNFISERCQEQKITMGINAIREICIKNPLAIDQFNLNYIAEYYSYKNKNVSSSAKSLINYYRDVNPTMLEKKYRGRVTEIDEEFNYLQNFGEEKIHHTIPGIELLKEREQKTQTDIPLEMDRILDDKDFLTIRKLQQKQKQNQLFKNEQKIQKMRLKLANQSDEEIDNEMDELNELNEDNEDDEIDEEIDELNEDELNEDELNEDELNEDEDYISISSDESIDDENQEIKEEIKPKEEKKKRVKENESDSLSSIELEDDEEDNPHGFLSANQINNYKMSKSERKKFLIDANIAKQKYTPNRKEKTGFSLFSIQCLLGGTTNKEKLKKKPLSMLRPKKNKVKRENEDKRLANMKKNIKSLKIQIGHFGKGKAHKEKHRSKILRKKIQKQK